MLPDGNVTLECVYLASLSLALSISQWTLNVCNGWNISLRLATSAFQLYGTTYFPPRLKSRKRRTRLI